MIPREFFDWALTQWWGVPAFISLFLGALIVFSWGFAVALGMDRR